MFPKHYSMMKEHPASFEIHDKRTNSSFHIAKQHLDPASYAKMAKIPKFSDGGNVSGAQSAQDSMRKAFHFYEGTTKVPAKPSPTPDPSSAPNVDQNAAKNIMDSFNKRVGPHQIVGEYTGGEIQKLYAKGIVEEPNDSPQFKAKVAEESEKGGSGIAGTNPEQRALTDLEVQQANAPIVSVADPNKLSNAQLANVQQAQGNGVASDVSQDSFNPDQEEGNANAAADQSAGIQQASDQTVSPVEQSQQTITPEQALDSWKKSVPSGPAPGSIDDFMSRMDKARDEISSPTGSYKQLADAVSSNKIDPSKYWNGHSKVAASLGIILGGIGQGLMHSNTNQALAVVQDGINREIDAQAKNNANQMDLLKLNNGNRLATWNQLATMAQVTLAKQAQQVQNPLAQAQAGLINQQIEQAKIKNNMMQKSLEFLNDPKAQQGGQQQGIINNGRWQALKTLGIMNEGDEKDATKEATSYINHLKQSQVVNQTFDDAVKQNSIGGRIGRLGFEPPAVGAFQSSLMPYLKDAEGRINETELQRTDKFKPQPGDRPDTILYKRQALNKFLEEKSATPVMDRLQLVNKASIAPQIATKNGIQYKKVAGGWQRITPTSNVAGE